MLPATPRAGTVSAPVTHSCLPAVTHVVAVAHQRRMVGTSGPQGVVVFVLVLVVEVVLAQYGPLQCSVAATPKVAAPAWAVRSRAVAGSFSMRCHCR